MIACPTCGERVPVVRSVNVVGRLLIPSHLCRRFLVAECWEDGVVILRWTSEKPGETGPRPLVRWHRDAADRGWQLPAGPKGWTYHWQEAGA